MRFGPLATTSRSLIATADSQTSSSLTAALQGLQAVATGCTDQLLKFAAAPAFTLLLTVPCGPPEHTGLIPARRPLPLSVRVRGSAPLCCLGAPWPRGLRKASLFCMLAETLLQGLGIAEVPCPGSSLQSKDAPSLSAHL